LDFGKIQSVLFAASAPAKSAGVDPVTALWRVRVAAKAID